MKIVKNIHCRPSVKLVTPVKGGDGDLVIESDLPATDIGSILVRYAGRLEDFRRWRGQPVYGDCTALPADLQDAFERVKRAHDAFMELPDNPFSSFDEAMKAIESGTIEKMFHVEHSPETTKQENTTNETSANQ